ncbi:sugar ABC transporter substrate-binding protein [Streptomyces ochraceiscleroticus]|uniref:Sugar ABC transporter substrate-binding protein n=1 Tax=Streptomyces ochraceiscleroticus TaxID=47761 RepID=A0ABW1MQZ2_9ACTN|nr:substrate-binding domain-containing protein [Streptomyces ochraceiscleroticus]
MSKGLRRAVLVGVAVSLAVGLGACGQAGESGGSHTGTSAGLRIGLLLPENQTARYETFDRPLIEKKVKELCGRCTVEYANAQDNVSTQQQANAMISKDVDVLILDSVDSKSLRSAVTAAKNADIPVVSYDRLVEGPVSAFVSYDLTAIGKAQGEALLKAVGNNAGGGRIVRVEGPTSGARDSSEEGALSVLEGKVKITKPYTAAAWNAENAHAAMSGAIAAQGADTIKGVWAGNDVIAAGAISALKDAHIEPLPPVVGQDAELAAVQRIVSGEMYMSVYKPYKPEADAAATMAIALGRGQGLGNVPKDRVNSATAKDIPAVLLTPVSLTVHNIKSTVVKDGTYTVDQICTPKYRSACERAGLTE